MFKDFHPQPRDIKHSQDQEPGGIEVTLDVQDEDAWPHKS